MRMKAQAVKSGLKRGLVAAVLGLSLIAAPLGRAAASPAIASPEACRAAAAAFAHWAAGWPRQAVGSEAPVFPKAVVPADELRRGWKGAGPPPTLVARLYAAPAGSVLACPAVLALARRGGHPVLSADPTSPTYRGKTDTQLLGLPILSPDGRQALAYVAVGGPLAGGANYLYLMERRKTGWSVVDLRLVSQS